MDDLTNIFKNNLQKLLADNKVYINKKTLSSSIGYSTQNSITKDLNGSKEPFWQKTCKCIEYLYANVPCFTLNDFIFTMEDKQEDKKSFAELEKDYKTLKTKYEQLEKQYNKLNQFVNFINIIKTLSTERQDTLFNLISAECFADFLTKLREYSHRALIFDSTKKLSHGSTEHFFKPYDYLSFALADILCQQTILTLRNNYLSKKQEDTQEEWTANRQNFINEKINEINQTGKIRGRNTRVKNVIKKYSDEAYKYNDKFLKKFGNINADLTRWKFDPSNFNNKPLWDDSIYTYIKEMEQVDKSNNNSFEEDEQFKKGRSDDIF